MFYLTRRCYPLHSRKHHQPYDNCFQLMHV
jgi:hypothetical protein